MIPCEVIVPWRGGCSHRERALGWVLERLSYPVRIAETDEPWCKALAVMPAIEASDAEIVCVHDADVWCQGLPQAVEAVREGAAWAVPHKGVFRLSEQGTAQFLAGEEDFERLALEERPYAGVMGGGIIVARREALLDVPMDPRFVGWGQEDYSWGHALEALVGHCWRGKVPLVHLFHPSQERMNRRTGSVAGRQLWNRYRAAVDRPEAMRALIEEARVALNADKPNVLDRDSAGVR